MKFKKYNAENSRSIPQGMASVKIHKTGVISFSRKASHNAGFSLGDSVEFFQSKEDPADWYFSKTKNSNGFKIRKGNKGGKNITFVVNSACVANEILKSLSVEVAKGASFKVTEKPVEKHEGKDLFLIITSEPYTAGRRPK
jgi:hypothetical protein